MLVVRCMEISITVAHSENLLAAYSTPTSEDKKLCCRGEAVRLSVFSIQLHNISRTLLVFLLLVTSASRLPMRTKKFN